uniref:Uncharacterized protein n=1 Tax=Drosophila pseudoobscura pseudoobscura TaxID=46245 RepID=A0A0R3NWW9_DROPS
MCLYNNYSQLTETSNLSTAMDDLEIIFIDSQPESTINLDYQLSSVDLYLIFGIKTQTYLESNLYNFNWLSDIKWDFPG